LIALNVRERYQLADRVFSQELSQYGLDASRLSALFLCELYAYLQYTSGESATRGASNAKDAALVVAMALAPDAFSVGAPSASRWDEIRTIASAVIPLLDAHKIHHRFRWPEEDSQPG